MPRSRAVGTGAIKVLLMEMLGISSQCLKREERWMISVLLGLQASLFLLHQISISLTQSSNLVRIAVLLVMQFIDK